MKHLTFFLLCPLVAASALTVTAAQPSAAEVKHIVAFLHTLTDKPRAKK